MQYFVDSEQDALPKPLPVSKLIMPFVFTWSVKIFIFQYLHTFRILFRSDEHLR